MHAMESGLSVLADGMFPEGMVCALLAAVFYGENFNGEIRFFLYTPTVICSHDRNLLPTRKDPKIGRYISLPF